jgi:hypothetical protein
VSERPLSAPPMSERPALLPGKPDSLRSGAHSGSSGLHSTTLTTVPEMAAVRPAARQSVPSWVEDSEYDRDTEITDLLENSARMSLAEAKDRAILVRLDGVEAGQVATLDGVPLGIGRHASNRLRITDAGISRFHARVFQRGASTWVEDLDSQNGTFVTHEGERRSRQRVRQARLEDGDIVHF